MAMHNRRAENEKQKRDIVETPNSGLRWERCRCGGNVVETNGEKTVKSP
jgi:hypothetical protein